MLWTVIMHSFITVTVFEQLKNLLKANEMFNFFRLMLQKKRFLYFFYCRCRWVRLTMLVIITKNAPRELKGGNRQEKIPHLYQEKS